MPDGHHLHLALNHFPVVGFPLLFLLALAGWFFKNRSLQISSALGVLVVSLFALVAFETGEVAEERVESLRPETEHWVEEHEELAEKVIWLIAINAGLEAGVLAREGAVFQQRKKRSSKTAMVFFGKLPEQLYHVLMVSLLVTSIGLGWVANLGGQIAHPELRSNPRDH